MWTCEYCQRSDFTSGHSFGAHKTNCSLNPKRKEIDKKNSISNTIPRKLYTFACPRCEQSFERLLSVKEHLRFTRKPKFCSRTCGNTRVHSQSTKDQIGSTLSQKPRKPKKLPYKNLCPCVKKSKMSKPKVFQARICIICNGLHFGFGETCSVPCKNRLISSQVTGKTGGWRNFGGNGIKGTLQGYLYQSSWERAWIFHALENHIVFRRCTEHFLYTFEDKQRKYYPDFFLEESQTYVEVKGFWSKRSEAKINSIPNTFNVQVIGAIEIKPMLAFYNSRNGAGGR